MRLCFSSFLSPVFFLSQTFLAMANRLKFMRRSAISNSLVVLLILWLVLIKYNVESCRKKRTLDLLTA